MRFDFSVWDIPRKVDAQVQVLPVWKGEAAGPGPGKTRERRSQYHVEPMHLGPYDALISASDDSAYLTFDLRVMTLSASIPGVVRDSDVF